MRINWDRLLTSTLVACALITTGLVVYRGMFVSATGPEALSSPKPVLVENWRSQLGKGRWLGSPDAQVQLIEFADYECPYCASFHTMLETLRDRYPTQIGLSFVHYPLAGHRNAEQAARAAECAAEQARFEAMHASLFERQNLLGVKSWREFASEAGVPDIALFETCLQGEQSLRRIIEGKQLAEQLAVRGTPTVVVNGWMLGRPPSAEELERMVKLVLAGKSPVSDES